jgi:HSP20 family molecular chaperone IbpA
MTKVARDMDQVHQKLIETLNRKHEREVKRMNEIHSENTGQIRKGQALDLVTLQDQNERQVADENEKKERILSQMKGNLDESKRLTEKQLKELTDFKAKSVADLQVKNSTDRERISGEHNETLENMNQRYNQASRKINLEGQERVTTLTNQQNEQLSNRKDFGQKKIDEQHIRHNERFQKDSEKYIRIKNEQDNVFKKERMTTYKKQEAGMAQMTELHAKEVEKRDKLKRGDLKDQELFFEKRYDQTFKRHNEHLKVLDQTQDKAVKALKEEMTKEVELKKHRAEDSFFQFVEMKPVIEHTENGIRIKVKVPDHSKQDLQLNLNGKEAIVNFNRRYIDNKKDELGNSSRVSKIETLSTRLQTGVHLDPKSVKSSYQDGVMTYEIKRA